MKDTTHETIYRLLLSHAANVRNFPGREYLPSLQRITEYEMNKFKKDYTEVWKGNLRKDVEKKPACLGILKKNIHYQLLDSLFFKILYALLKPFNVLGLTVGNLEARIIFEEPKILLKALEYILGLSTHNVTVEIKVAPYTMIIYIGKQCLDKKEQVKHV